MSTASAIRVSAATVTILIGSVAVPLNSQVILSASEDTVEERLVSPAPVINVSAGEMARDTMVGAAPPMASSGPASVITPDAGSGVLPVQSTKMKRPDFNRDIYYKNKLEVSLESGWLPINVPFVWDFVVDSAYSTNPLPYTMVPNTLSLRWQHGDVRGHTWLRGNWDHSFGFSYTDVVRGPETRYFAFDYKFRRNFVQPRWRLAPYFEMGGGGGDINAKGYKVTYGQGQDLTFTYTIGAGARWNFNPKWSIAGGVTYMHVSNFYLSEPKIEDYGINVYGPVVGINMRLGKEKRHAM